MEPPIKPQESDCCKSDCNPCILDVYEEKLKKYNRQKQSDCDQMYPNCISPTCYTVFKVFDIQQHAADALLITFEYVKHSNSSNEKTSVKNSALRLIYEPGEYFLMKAGPRNNEFTRAYTPIPSDKSSNLRFTIIVKLYEGGRMSKYLEQLKTGSETEWRGPYGKSTVDFTHKYKIFIAQGVGIAPIYSTISKLVESDDCSTFLKLFYCCKSPSQIYLRDQLHELQANWNFNYEIFLSNSGAMLEKYNEMVRTRKLDIKAIKEHVRYKTEAIQVVICGSEIFAEYMKGLVLECNVPEENIFLF